MDVITLDSTNFTCLTSRYKLDETLKFNETVFFTEQGINIALNNALKNAYDNKINNYSNLILSNNELLTSAVHVQNLDKLDDDGFSSFIAINAAGTLTPSTRFWVVDEPAIAVNKANIKTDGELSKINNQYFFDIELLTDQYCKITHENENVTRYLTVDYSGNLSFTKDCKLDILGELSPQIFYYVYDRAYNYMVLIKNINDIPKYVSFNVNNQSLTLVDPITATSIPYSISCIFRLRQRNAAPNNTLMLDPWVSYKKDLKTNSQDINDDRSFKDVKFNLLLNSEFYNISGGSIDFNVLSLKNTNTPENKQSRANPFFNENNIEFRDYQSLITGSNQTKGNDNISLNYESYTTEILFKKDKVTYFHIPQIFYPFSRLNINDSNLTDAGAIAGDHPLKSDKIFKKKADYKYTSQYGDTIEETSGDFLCAWLSGSTNPETKPVWVDRYYNPKSISFMKALTSQDFTAIKYISLFDCIAAKASDKLGPDIAVFDKPSDLVFEKGTYYAYHHYGPGDTEKFIKTLSENLICNNLPIYKYYDGTDVYYSTEQASEFIFDGNTYAVTSNLSSIQASNQFTLMFDGHSSDWNKSLGYQLIGNYDRDGFGIFNENVVTPTLFINSPSAIKITNIDGKTLNSLTFNSDVKGIIRLQGMNDFYLIMEDNTLRRYNLAYAETRRNLPATITNKLGNLLSLDYSETYGYALINNGSINVPDKRLCLINFNSNEITDISFQNARYPKIIANNLSFSTSNTVNYYNGKFYFTQGSKAERANNDIFYLIDNNKIYFWKDIDSSTTITNINSAFYSSTSIEDFSFDFDNNIWILYNNYYFAKYTADREFILSGYIADTGFKNFKINFVADFEEGNYKRYAILTRKSQSDNTTIKNIKLNFDGTEVSTFNTIQKTGFNNNPCLNFSNNNFLRSFIKEKYPDSNLNIKAKLTNVFDMNDSLDTEIVFALSSLDAGYHHFGVRFDADGGYMFLFVDGQIKGITEFQPRKYKFSNIVYRPFLIGSSNYSFSIPLFSYLKNKSFLTNNFKIKNFYLYDRPLNDFDIIMHARKGMKMRDLYFDIACGRRNYLEEIERYFKLTTPSSKSTLFNLIIRNSGITDISLKTALEKRILNILKNSVPAHTKLNTIKWSN